MKEEIVAVSGKLSKAPKPAANATRVVRIRSTVDGFRRAGLKHPSTSVDHPAEKITDEQFDQLAGEPKLMVIVVDQVEDKKSEK